MKKVIVSLAILLVIGGVVAIYHKQAPQQQSTPPASVAVPPVIITPTPTPTPIPPPIPTPIPSVSVEDIKAMAVPSTCASYNFKDRGHMAPGYVQGVALVFARALCNQDRADVKILMQKPTGDQVHDALTWYSQIFSDLKMTNEVPLDALRHTYVLLLGLGMRESTGRYCCGRDMSANFSTADSAEAGAWQASWGARRVSSELPKMFTKYQDKIGCFLQTFQDGVETCSATNLKNWGEGDGAKWQELTKGCPAFAAEYAAVLLRLTGGSKGEFGPLRKHEAEVRPECDTLFKKIQDKVLGNKDFCAILNGHK